MKILSFSDIHIWQDKNPDIIRALGEKIEERNPDILIAGGDIDDPWKSTWEEILDSPAHQELQRIVDKQVTLGKRVIVLRRNHDWNAKPNYLRGAEMMRWFKIGNQEYRHGDEFAMDWAIIGPAIFKLSTNFPQLMVPIYHLLYKTPTQVTGEEWNWKIGLIHLKAETYARKHKVNLDIGHTHSPLRRHLGHGLFLTDRGDLEDSLSLMEVELGKPPKILWLRM